MLPESKLRRYPSKQFKFATPTTYKQERYNTAFWDLTRENMVMPGTHRSL